MSHILKVFAFLLFASSSFSSSFATPGPNWWTEDPEAGIKLGQQTSKNVLIYWGAVWCPPCNAMKAEVFPKPEFLEAAKNFLPVMIDGDSDDAQKFSDRYGVTGYPTLLVIAPDGSERLRLVGYLQLDATVAALGAVDASPASLTMLVQRAVKKEPLSDLEWRRLTYSDWSQFSEKDLGGKAPVDVAYQLFGAVPESLPRERALLASFVINNAADASATSQASVRSDFEALFGALNASEATRLASQVTLLEGVRGLKWFLEGGISEEQKNKRLASWQQAVDQLTVSLDQSLNARVNIAGANSALFELKAPQHKSQKDLKTSLKSLKDELYKTGDEHTKVSLIPVVADGFVALGQTDKGLRVLEEAAAVSTVPWYFYRHMAAIYKDQKDFNQASRLADRARKVAQGSATKIQWTQGYIDLLNQSQVKSKDRKLAEGLSDLFELAVAAVDGFKGRNVRSMTKASALVQKNPKLASKLAPTIAKYRARCDGLAPQDVSRKEACQRYFDEMAPKAADGIGKKDSTTKQAL